MGESDGFGRAAAEIETMEEKSPSPHPQRAQSLFGPESNTGKSIEVVWEQDTARDGKIKRLSEHADSLNWLVARGSLTRFMHGESLALPEVSRG